MASLLFFLILATSVVLLHLLKQKNSTEMYNKVASTLNNQLDLEKQKSEVFKENICSNYDVDLKIDILKNQVHLLELLSNQTN